MNRAYRYMILTTLTGFTALVAADAAYGQMPRAQVGATPQTTAPADGPAFRDPKTGQIWTPENVGENGKPVSPSDRAFDPRAQAVVVQGVVEQHVQTHKVGGVAITAGPTVPLVEIDNLTLRVVPGARWQVVLYLNNNSAKTFSPVIECQFDNGPSTVEKTRGLLPPTAGGDRVGFTIYGPRSETFVDSVHCRVASP